MDGGATPARIRMRRKPVESEDWGAFVFVKSLLPNLMSWIAKLGSVLFWKEEEKRIIASNLEIAIPRDHTDSWYQGSPGQGLAQNLHSVQSNCGEAMSLLTSVTPRGSDFTLNWVFHCIVCWSSFFYIGFSVASFSAFRYQPIVKITAQRSAPMPSLRADFFSASALPRLSCVCASASPTVSSCPRPQYWLGRPTLRCTLLLPPPIFLPREVFYWPSKAC